MGSAMGVRLGILRGGARSARELALHSRAALDRPLREPGELWTAIVRDEALVLGAFQRGAQVPRDLPLVRRGSGGPEVRVGPGTVHVALALASPGALIACDEKRIVNRSVRPLLRALTKVGCLAHFFGRDWVSVNHRPVAWVGFAHDAASRRTLFEAFIAVKTPFHVSDRASFLGKSAGTLESVGGAPIEPERLVDATVAAYLAAWGAEGREVETPEVLDEAEDLRADPPWTATCEEAIGTLGAGPDAHGVFRVGGDLLVSRDALARLETRVAQHVDDDLGRVVDDTLAAPGVALEGVRSLVSVRDLLERACAHRTGQ
jgi:hypothetical protein